MFPRGRIPGWATRFRVSPELSLGRPPHHLRPAWATHHLRPARVTHRPRRAVLRPFLTVRRSTRPPGPGGYPGYPGYPGSDEAPGPTGYSGLAIASFVTGLVLPLLGI